MQHTEVPQFDNLAYFRANLPKKPYCSNNKTAKNIYPARLASGYAYIQPNPPGMLFWLVFDIDRKDAWLDFDCAIAPLPNIVVSNPENGHAHFYYALKAPVNTGENGRDGPKAFAAAVYRGLGSILAADAHYARLMAKNPLHSEHHTLCPREEAYELTELDEFIWDRQAGKKWIAAAHAEGAVVNEEGRHSTLFDRLRQWAYSWVDEYHSNGASFGAWQAACLGHAEAQNYFPGHKEGALPDSHVRATARSVSKWVWNIYEGKGAKDAMFPLLQAARGQLKGKKKRDNLMAKAIALHSEGVSNRSISRQLEVNDKTIANWLKREVSNSVTPSSNTATQTDR